MQISVYAFVRGLSAIAFAPAVGLHIDTGNRLQVVRVSIVFQRIVVAASCAIFYILLKGLPADSLVGLGLLLLATLFVCIEKFRSMMNLVSVKKDRNVEAESRGALSSVEAAWQNMFELLS
ncbi:hypothetical protein CEP54_011969 [Fusarium duplospermum]|uniref:Solute carrier family 40 member n=1 Tax=Fusarium duplospermum TaxID=1325734 RepID=A0A428PB75_9HYPO|nr:hypothetical protein CEP54_011969 [Fusarium duplospermum]